MISLCDFEDAKQPQSSQDADPEGGPGFDGSPDHLKDAAYDDLRTHGRGRYTPNATSNQSAAPRNYGRSFVTAEEGLYPTEGLANGETDTNSLL